MPIYAYRCASCGHQKDVLQKLSDQPLTQCPECGKDTFSKQVTAAGFQLKGSGWYVTDFRGGSNSNNGGNNGASDGASNAESGGAPAKSDSDASGADKSANSKAGDSAGSASVSSSEASGSTGAASSGAASSGAA